MITATGFLSALAMREALLERGQRAMAVLLVLIMALCGLVMTRDVFNLFVFVELIVIASAGLVLLSEDGRAIAAGFKYLIVAQVISVLLLIGIIFTYHANGSLNIDDIAAQPMTFYGPSLALFLVLIALMLELKPFPANGWALDIYEAAHPGFSALFSAASGTAALFAADKLFAAAGPAWLPLATGVGLITFLAANVLALSQNQRPPAARLFLGRPDRPGARRHRPARHPRRQLSLRRRRHPDHPCGGQGRPVLALRLHQDPRPCRLGGACGACRC